MKKAQILFIAVFIVIIYGIGVLQAVVEYRKDKSVQFLDVFEDTFVQPVRRQNAIAAQLEKLGGQIDGLSAVVAATTADETGGFTYADESVAKAEEALYTIQDLRATALQVNRHMSLDSAESELIVSIDTLRVRTQEIFTAMQQAADEPAALAQKIGAVREAVLSLQAGNGRVSALGIPGLAFTHFVEYTAFKRKYLRGYEGEMEKASVVANTTRPVMQFMKYVMYGDLGEKAIYGSNGWFFYKPGVDFLTRPWVLDPRSYVVDPNGKPLTDDPIRAIVQFKRQLDSLGIELLVVICPIKPTVYPDMLNPDISPGMSGKITHSIRAMEELKKQGVEAVDLFTPFAEERKNDPQEGDSMYLRTDTHWKARGVRTAARVVAQRIRQFPWYADIAGTAQYALDTVYVDRVGDIGTMTQLPAFRIHDLTMGFPPENTKCYQVYEVTVDSTGNETGRRLFRDDFRRSKILVIGDSFSRIYQSDAPNSAGWISHLAAELQVPMSSIVSDGGASTLVRQTLARKAGVLRGRKLVVWEFVERDFRFGAEGWKDVALEMKE